MPEVVETVDGGQPPAPPAPTVEQREAEQGFETGFSRVTGKELEKKPGDVKTGEDEAAAGKAEADSKARAEADSKARAKADADRAKFMDALPTRLRNIEGRIGGLVSKLDSALAAAKAVTQAQGKATPTQDQVTAAQGSTERWKRLEQDFPEWTAALNERLAGMAEELAGKLPAIDQAAIKREIIAGIAPMFESARNEGRTLALVDLKHEGWEDTVKTKEFGAWLKVQTPEIQALADSEKAPDAIKLLDAYKAHNDAAVKAEEERQRNQKRLAGNLTPTGTGTPQAGGITDEQAFERGFKRIRGGSK